MARFDFSRAIEILDDAKTVVVCGHVNPDGDCIGSVLALSAALKAKGLDVTPLLATRDCPQAYDFLEGYADLTPACEYKGEPDVFFSVDVPSSERTGDGDAVFKRAAKSIAIDHHQGTCAFADAAYVDEHAAAAGIIVWEFIEQLGVERTPQIADCCYAALLTDTGRFQFQNADERAFEAAAQMVAAGASPSDIALKVYQRRTMASLKLDALVVERLQLVCGGKAAVSWVSEKDFAELGAVQEDGEGLIDLVRQIDGIEIAVMLRDQGAIVRGSIRSKTDRDVSAIAAKMNGGGHKAAAGFTVRGDLARAKKTVLKLLEKEFAAPAEGAQE